MGVGMIYLESVLKRMQDYKALGDKTFAQLTEEQLIQDPGTNVNSIAVIVQHLHGNMLSRWTNFLTEDGEKAWRNRDEEFEGKPLSREEILKLWEEGWAVYLQALRDLKEEDLLKTITIRNQPLNVIDAINRQVAHYSSHLGQIMLLGKYFKGSSWESLSIPKGGSNQFNQQLMHPNKS